MSKVVHESGKRKRAIARVTLKPGKGRITINNLNLEHHEPEMARMKIKEPIILARDTADKVDIDINVNGGGFMSQAEAARLGVGRALSTYNEKLKDLFLDYDRQLLVADVRRKEVSKPNRHGKARARRQKSYR
mgnify:CR=1 FL=1